MSTFALYGAKEWTAGFKIYEHKHDNLRFIMKTLQTANRPPCFYDFLVEKRLVS